MKVIIAGTRTFTDYSFLDAVIEESGFEITTVFCGGALGADTLGKQWAIKKYIPYKMFKPDWDRYKNFAGNLRNLEMARKADVLIALWDGRSTGTKHMIMAMNLYEKPVFIKMIPISQKSIRKSSEKHPKTGFFT